MLEDRRAPGRPRVGLALSGGGARGLAQVGVLKVLERERVPIDVIAGTSAGAIVGALYAALGDAAALETRVRDTLVSSELSGLELGRTLGSSGIVALGEEDRPERRPGLWGRARRKLRRLRASYAALTRSAVLPEAAVRRLFEGLFGDVGFEELAIPFTAVAVDLESGREVLIRNGPLAKAVAASAAVAGIFPPVEMGGRRLIDGGYTSPVPVDAVRAMEADVVMAVDVSVDGLDSQPAVNAVQVAMRSSEICLVSLEREQLRRADVTIRAGGRARHWSDYSEPDEAIAAGARATEGTLEHIRVALEEGSRIRL